MSREVMTMALEALEGGHLDRAYGYIQDVLAQPERKEWVGLTGDDLDDITDNAISIVDAMLLTEEKLKEKNS